MLSLGNGVKLQQHHRVGDKSWCALPILLRDFNESLVTIKKYMGWVAAIMPSGKIDSRYKARSHDTEPSTWLEPGHELFEFKLWVMEMFNSFGTSDEIILLG